MEGYLTFQWWEGRGVQIGGFIFKWGGGAPSGGGASVLMVGFLKKIFEWAGAPPPMRPPTMGNP